MVEEPSSGVAEFVMLLSLTDAGRGNPAGVRECLRLAQTELAGVGGTAHTVLVTYGGYDAVIVGSCSLSGLASFSAWIAEQMLFESHTLIGTPPATFESRKHG